MSEHSFDIIATRLQNLKSLIPEGIKLVAVSKFQPVSAIQMAYDAGQRCFGESRVKEFLDKKTQLPDDIEWHFIGHLQTNKVRSIIGKTYLIQSVDSLRLLDLIDAESEKRGVVTRVLLQVHVAAEETKFGFSPEEIMDFFKSKRYEFLKATYICGLMAMATNTEVEETIRQDFTKVASLFRTIKLEISPELRGFEMLSMGMSSDWPLAIEEGANIIRVGSAIFGSR